MTSWEQQLLVELLELKNQSRKLITWRIKLLLAFLKMDKMLKKNQKKVALLLKKRHY
jgi:hypothetical protein